MPLMREASSATVVEVIRGLALKRLLGSEEAELHLLRLGQPAQIILKAAVGAATLSNPAWAGSLAEMRVAAQDFLTRLEGKSAIVAMLDSGVVARAPSYIPLLVVTTAVTGSLVGEGKPRPISKANLGLATLVPQKVQATIVVTKDLLSEAPAAQTFLGRQLKNAVASAIDAVLVGQLLAGVTPIAATVNQEADLIKLLNAVNSGSGRLAWLSSVDVANRLALSNILGATSPVGASEYFGLPMYVSSGMLAGTLALVDGDRVAGNVEGFGLEVATDASLNMDDSPTLPTSVPPAGAATMVNLWQENAVALGMTMLGDMTAATGAVALLTGIAWSG
jgi:hypothetical protein